MNTEETIKSIAATLTEKELLDVIANLQRLEPRKYEFMRDDNFNAGDVLSSHRAQIWIESTRLYLDVKSTVESCFAALEGSEKQVKWAADIRASFVNETARKIVYECAKYEDAVVFDDYEVTNPADYEFGNRNSVLYSELLKATQLIARQKTAKYFIENKPDFNRAKKIASKNTN